MKAYTRDGAEIEIQVGGQYSDDIQILSAVRLDTNEELDDAELSWVERRFADEIYESWLEGKVMEAEYSSEGDR